LGYSALTTGEIWQDHPEKAFTMRADWVDKNPKATKALLMAVQEPRSGATSWKTKRRWHKSSPSLSGSTHQRKILWNEPKATDFGDGRVEEQPVHYEVLVK